FEVSHRAIITLPGPREDNHMANAQQLSNVQLCNALNKVSVEVEARLFGWNDRIKDLEEDLKKKEEELAAREKEL
ncbi:hypothetical protein KI387_025473, partial [Taxus chinensis]